MTVCRIGFHEAATESHNKQQRTVEKGLLQLTIDILAIICQWVATGDKFEAGKNAVRWGRVCILTHQLSHRLAVAIATTRSHCSAVEIVTASRGRSSTYIDRVIFENPIMYSAWVNELFFKNDIRGLYMMADDLRCSRVGRTDYPLSLHYYEKAAKLGHTKAAYELTIFFLQGKAEMGIIKNFQKARKPNRSFPAMPSPCRSNAYILKAGFAALQNLIIYDQALESGLCNNSYASPLQKNS